MIKKFLGIADQFSERDLRVEQRAGDTKLAVDAALNAAKETTNKIEAGFTKSIDAQQDVIEAITKSTDEKISDLKDRLTAIENRTAGINNANAENRQSNTDTSARTMAVVGLGVALVVGIGEIISRVAIH